MGISFGLFHIWNVPEHDTHHPNQSIPRQNSLLQKICFFSILRSVSLKSETKTSGSLRRMLEGFVQFTPKTFSDIFFILVLSTTLRNISFRWMNKNRNLFRLGHFEQKPEVTNRGRVVVFTKGTGAYLPLAEEQATLWIFL